MENISLLMILLEPGKPGDQETGETLRCDDVAWFPGLPGYPGQGFGLNLSTAMSAP